VAGGDGETRHRTDRRQRLAAEPKGADLQQVVAVELGGGVALDREIEIGTSHPVAVVGDADEPASAAVGCDIDPAGAGVERVLDQFFDHAGRPLDHFAGGDAVDGGLGKLADGHLRPDSDEPRIYRRNMASARAAAEMPPLFRPFA
jgi:hypothetical protein